MCSLLNVMNMFYLWSKSIVDFKAIIGLIGRLVCELDTEGGLNSEERKNKDGSYKKNVI